jgi:outer membrane lipoprotein LolB
MLRITKHTQGRHALGVFFVLLFAAALSGCATRPVISPSDLLQRTVDWQAHRRALEHLDQWSFSGRVAVKDKQQESWSASLDWHQRKASFDIRLSGAFGQEAARLSGKPGYAVIETADHDALSATSVEALMREQLGWSVPVEGFRYWLVGSPAPGVIDHYSLDADGRLTGLQQAGWQVRYRSYQTVAGLDLPRKLELENPRLRLRVVIDNWQLSAQESGHV